MTRLLLISKPKLAHEHRDWIETLRALSDPQHALVPAHFTLVFPVTNIDERSFVDHCTRIAGECPPIAFCLRSARAVKDPLRQTTHVYLIPEEGFAALVELHDRLYRGHLSTSRMNVPFIPHITVAAFADGARAREFEERLNAHPLAIEGMIDTLLVVRYGERTVEPVEEIEMSAYR